MEKIIPYVWLLILMVSIISETLSRKLVVIWLAPAAVISLLLGWCKADVWVQVLAFFAISVALIVLSAIVRHSGSKKAGGVGGVEETIGRVGRVLERVDNLAGCGQVEVDGQFWAARSMSEDVTFEAGCTVEVIAVEGVKLIVK